jgi:hypothetical protein
MFETLDEREERQTGRYAASRVLEHFGLVGRLISWLFVPKKPDEGREAVAEMPHAWPSFSYEKKFKPGDRVRFSAEYMRSGGQDELAARTAFYAQSVILRKLLPLRTRWTVQACSCLFCQSEKVVATDEASIIGGWTHIAVANLEAADEHDDN